MKENMMKKAVAFLQEAMELDDETRDTVCGIAKELGYRIARPATEYKDMYGATRRSCPRCMAANGRPEILYAGQKFCSVCGQKIDTTN